MFQIGNKHPLGLILGFVMIYLMIQFESFCEWLGIDLEEYSFPIMLGFLFLLWLLITYMPTIMDKIKEHDKKMVKRVKKLEEEKRETKYSEWLKNRLKK